MKRFVYFLGLGYLLACGSTQQVVTTKLDFAPVVVKPTTAKDHLTFYDAKEVFDRGRLARAFDKYADCIRYFSIVIKEFRDSKYAEPSIYNRGLCYESDGKPHEAAKDFEHYAKIATTPESRLDGLFRLLHNLVEIEHNTKALALTQTLLKLPLEELDEAEVLNKQGAIMSRLGEKEAAKRLLLKASRLAKKGAQGFIHSNSVYAEAEYLLGEISLEAMQQRKLTLPLEVMKGQLAEKLRHFRKSQLHLLNAVKAQVKRHSTHAGERLGALYASLYGDLIEAEKPPSLTKTETDVYYEELLTRIRPVLKNAITIYEKSITLGKRLGETNEWLDTVNQQKERLEKLLDSVKDDNGDALTKDMKTSEP